MLNLETAVGREKDVNGIDVHGEYEKLVVTLLVMRGFLDFPGASRACAYFRDLTAVSRFEGVGVPAVAKAEDTGIVGHKVDFQFA